MINSHQFPKEFFENDANFLKLVEEITKICYALAHQQKYDERRRNIILPIF